MYRFEEFKLDATGAPDLEPPSTYRFALTDKQDRIPVDTTPRISKGGKVEDDTYARAASLCDECAKRLTLPSSEDAAALGVALDSLLSIFNTRFIEYSKRLPQILRDPPNAARIRAMLKQGATLCHIADSMRVPRLALARVMLPSLARVPAEQARELVRHPEDIKDAGLRDQVRECLDTDAWTAPAVDHARNVVGSEFEAALEAQLRALGIPFRTERDLREAGTHRTPDIHLPVPVAIPGPHGPLVVNWIDSKAYFGDPDSHAANMEQLRAYCARYGPGLVIYWFGYVASIDSRVNIAVRHRLPDEIVVLRAPPTTVVLDAGGGESSAARQ